MKGWWCVRYGDALAWVEAPSDANAVSRSLDLCRSGDRTDDARELVVFGANGVDGCAAVRVRQGDAVSSVA